MVAAVRFCSLLGILTLAASRSVEWDTQWSALLPRAREQRARFASFHFSCSGDAVSSTLDAARAWALAVRHVAREYGAFGWVQVQGNASVTGEVRGTVSTTPVIEAFLRAGPPTAASSSYAAAIEAYADSRIKLHFANFKLLTSDRAT